MSVRIPVFLICIAAAGLAFPASRQDSGNRPVTAQVGNSAQTARVPYMAEFKTTQTSTLPNGSTVTHETTEVVAIDARGRRMTATTRVPSQGVQTPETRFTIIDPMAHTKIIWTSPGREVSVAAIPVPAASECAWMTFSNSTVELDRHGRIIPPITKTTTEDLGTETIHGVEAQGKRTTTTTRRANKKIQPQVSIFETWTATDPGLRSLLVRQVNDNPQSGKMTKELVKFRQSEPDPSIFRLPPGYEIVNREVALDNCPSAEEMEPAAVPAP